MAKNCMNTIRNQNYDAQSLTSKEFLSLLNSGVRFVNCTFRHSYIGTSYRQYGKAVPTSLANVMFVNCDLLGCNFKGAKNLTPKNFVNPQNIGTTHNLPPTVIKHFKDSGCLYSQELRDKYADPNVMNASVTTSKRIRSITDFFVPTPLKKARAEEMDHSSPKTLEN